MNPHNSSLCARVSINPELAIVLPDSADLIVFAAIMNAGLGS